MTKIDMMQMMRRPDPPGKRTEQPDSQKTGFDQLLKDKKPLETGGTAESKKASSAKEKESPIEEKDDETADSLPADTKLPDLAQSQLISMLLLQEDKTIMNGQWLQPNVSEEAGGQGDGTCQEELLVQTGGVQEGSPPAAGVDIVQQPAENGLAKRGIMADTVTDIVTDTVAKEQVKPLKATESTGASTQKNRSSPTEEKPLQESVEPPAAGEDHTKRSEADSRDGELTEEHKGNDSRSLVSTGTEQTPHVVFREHTESFTPKTEDTGASNMVKTTPADLPADIGKNLAASMPGKNGTLTIELEPASLGKVLVKVVYEAGRTSVSLIASNPKTLEILSRNAGEIAGILESKTGQETMIYTASAQTQYSDAKEEGRRERREPKQEEHGRRKNQSDSFVQQLRLGLV